MNTTLGRLGRLGFALAPWLLCATACTSGSPRRVDPTEMTRLLTQPVATMSAETPLAISGDRAYVELWEQGAAGGSVEILWTPAPELSDDIRARFPER